MNRSRLAALLVLLVVLVLLPRTAAAQSPAADPQPAFVQLTGVGWLTRTAEQNCSHYCGDVGGWSAGAFVSAGRPLSRRLAIQGELGTGATTTEGVTERISGGSSTSSLTQRQWLASVMLRLLDPHRDRKTVLEPVAGVAVGITSRTRHTIVSSCHTQVSGCGPLEDEATWGTGFSGGLDLRTPLNDTWSFSGTLRLQWMNWGEQGYWPIKHDSYQVGVGFNWTPRAGRGRK